MDLNIGYYKYVRFDSGEIVFRDALTNIHSDMAKSGIRNGLKVKSAAFIWAYPDYFEIEGKSESLNIGMSVDDAEFISALINKKHKKDELE
jgi:hypothetical protein